MATRTKLTLTAVDKTRRAFESAGRNVASLESTVMKAQRAFGLLLGAGAVGGAVKSFAQAGIAMERLERGLKAATGSAAGAAAEMQFVRDESLRLGLNLESTAGAYTSLAAAARGTSLEGEQARQIFTAISEASRVMGLSVDQTEGALRAIEQMISKGNVQAEELRGQLGERLPGAFQIAARAIGVTTEQLNDMLDRGEVLAGDLLPALATELRETFGPEVENAANDAQAAFARFETAIFDLKASIADSGVLDALSDLADKMRQAIGGATVAEDIARVRREIQAMKDAYTSAGGIGDIPDTVLRPLREELLALLQTKKPLAAEAEELNEIYVRAKKRASDYDQALGKLSGKFQTAEQRAATLRAELSRFRDDLSMEQIALIEDEISEIMTGGLEEIVITAKRRFTEPMKDEFDEIRAASEQAARNIQDAFADFLFDPFEDGIQGMVKGFLDAIRRMLANQAAIGLFGFLRGFLGGSGSTGVAALGRAGLENMFGPGFKDGGSFVVGGSGGPDSQFVPFFATPGERVTVSKPGQSAGNVNHFSISVDASGGDADRLLAVLPPAIEQAVETAVGQMYYLRDKGRF